MDLILNWSWIQNEKFHSHRCFISTLQLLYGFHSELILLLRPDWQLESAGPHPYIYVYFFYIPSMFLPARVRTPSRFVLSIIFEKCLLFFLIKVFPECCGWCMNWPRNFLINCRWIFGCAHLYTSTFVWCPLLYENVHFSDRTLINIRIIQYAFFSFQRLVGTESTTFTVSTVLVNAISTWVAISGPHGLCAMRLPRRSGSQALFQGGRDTIFCRFDFISITSGSTNLLIYAFYKSKKCGMKRIRGLERWNAYRDVYTEITRPYPIRSILLFS